jgi:Zn-dependent M28 family amino/carboxypeptidase
MKLRYTFLLLSFAGICSCGGGVEDKMDTGLDGIVVSEWPADHQLDPGADRLPVVRNFSAAYDRQQKKIKISYDVEDKEEKRLAVGVYYLSERNNYLRAFEAPGSGDVGDAVLPGEGKKVEVPFSNEKGLDSLRLVLMVDDRIVFPVSAYLDKVDTAALRKDIAAIYGLRNRVSDSVHLAFVKKLLGDSLTKYGYVVSRQKFVYKGYTAENIIARKPGFGKLRKKVVLCAHYDTVIDSPGADDNASGIAALLETVRILSSLPAENAVEIVLLDLEEPGMVGSRKYVEAQSLKREEIISAVNLDMIGYMSTEPFSQHLPQAVSLAFPAVRQKVEQNESKGDFVVCIANERSAELRDAFIGGMARYLPDRKVISILTPGKSEVLTYLRYSDHSSFWDKEYPALFIGDGSDSRNPNYHSPWDTMGSLNYPFMRDCTAAVLAFAIDQSELRHGSVIWKTIRL